jgi:FixJ family two-component response regulator
MKAIQGQDGRLPHSTLVLFLELSFVGIMGARFIEASTPVVCLPEIERMITDVPLISIVDDDDTLRAATESLVRSLGFKTRTFASAETFLQSPSPRETRCLILDVQMPNMSGIELQERLSELGFTIPIIFVTAYPDESVKQRAMEAGAVAFLLKPLDGHRFVDCLFETLKQE